MLTNPSTSGIQKSLPGFPPNTAYYLVFEALGELIGRNYCRSITNHSLLGAQALEDLAHTSSPESTHCKKTGRWTYVPYKAEIAVGCSIHTMHVIC